MIEIITLIFLIIFALYDQYRECQIPFILCQLFLVFGLIVLFTKPDQMQILGGVFFAGIYFILYYALHKILGAGDAEYWIMPSLGLIFGVNSTLILLFTSLAVIFHRTIKFFPDLSMIFLDTKYKFPFMPFVLTGYIMMLVVLHGIL